MKTRTETILKIMNVVAWITFIGLMIEAGALLVAYCISIGNPTAAHDLYRGLDLYALRQFSFGEYTCALLTHVLIVVAEAYTAFLVTKALSTIKLVSPFTMEVALLLERISYYILGTWVLVLSYNGYVKWLSKSIHGLFTNPVSGEFIFLAGVVFVMAQIFKKGAEIQSENELTV